MLLSVVETPIYLACVERLMSEAEREAIVDIVAANPRIGVLIPGSGGLRKMRIPLEGRGKRGGGRVIYWFYSERLPVVLLFALAKNEAADLTPKQARMLADETRYLPEDFGS